MKKIKSAAGLDLAVRDAVRNTPSTSGHVRGSALPAVRRCTVQFTAFEESPLAGREESVRLLEKTKYRLWQNASDREVLGHQD